MAKAEQMLAHRLQPGGTLRPRRTCRCSHHVNQALRAHALFQLDVDYMVKDGEVVIVDEFTGRLMPGRRWSDGLHQAVEAKEKVKIERENQTLATITFQNYFRKYKKLSGMTGTAETEAEEFDKIYKLDVIVIPTNRAAAAHRGAGPRLPDRDARSTTRSSTTSSRSRRRAGRCWSARSRSRSRSGCRRMLKRRGIKHVVLNAKYHAQEAEIVAQAGRKGTVTIATNMAGRGTDILLGGNPEFMARQQCAGRADRRAAARRARRSSSTTRSSSTSSTSTASIACRAPTTSASSTHFKQQTDAEHDEVVALGGLHIVGTERHEARRIDNQLRGRAGRQGDPGSSRFYLSLEDDLMRIFGSDRISGPDAAARHGRRRADRARDGDQGDRARAEAGRSAELLGPQAPARVRRRDEQAAREHLRAAPRDLEGKIQHRREEESRRHARLPDDARRGPRSTSTVDDLRAARSRPRGVGSRRARRARSRASSARSTPSATRSTSPSMTPDEMTRRALGAGRRQATRRRKRWSPTRRSCTRVERDIMLQIVDAQWKDHLYSLDHLKEGIGLRGYGQRDPLVEYKKESFELFQAMKDRVDEEIVRYLWRLMSGRRARRAPACRQSAAPAPRAPGADDAQRPVRRRPASPFGAIRGGGGGATAVGASRRGRRASAATTPVKTVQARRAEGRPQRSVPVRQRQEIQEVSRGS